MTQLVLASSSRYRKALLEQLQIPFSCHSPAIDESPLPNETPQALVLRLSEAKAREVGKTHKNHLIIGSDQVAECNNVLITKPGSFAAACGQLQLQSGNKVNFHTGVCLYNSGSGRLEVDIVTTVASFRKLSGTEIERYLHKEQPYDCAGSFKAEQLGIGLLDGMHGCDPSALTGLPLIRLCEMLRKEGVQLP